LDAASLALFLIVVFVLIIGPKSASLHLALI